MSFIKLQDKVPPVYPEGSRDFQLFCHLYDVIFNGIKNDIDGKYNELYSKLINLSSFSAWHEHGKDMIVISNDDSQIKEAAYNQACQLCNDFKIELSESRQTIIKQLT